MNSLNRKLRIAVVTTHPPSKGTLNEYGFHFVKALRQKPEVEEVILLLEELPNEQTYTLDDAGAPVSVRQCWRFGAWNNSLRIVKAVRDTKPDVVLFNIQFASFGSGKVAAALGLTAPTLVKAAGYPTVVLLHNIMETVDLNSAGFADNRLISTLIRVFGYASTRMLLASDLVALTIPKYVEILEQKYRAKNVILAPHGAFETPPMPNFELPDGPMRIMTFGKFGTYKKVEGLIEATDMLRNNGRPSVELVVAGSDSPNTPGYLENAAHVYKDVGGITFTGYVPEEEVPRIFQESAVVVFPYTSTTGSSGVLHQAGSYGKAVVLPNIGDLSELITEEGYTGEFFEPTCAESLKDAIARVLDDPERRVQMGRQNYLASCGLPIGDVVDWYLLHMQELIREKES
jgi:glycosyltransferase involved in cell wall biosynthesis